MKCAIVSEKHAGLCVCCGRPGHLAHNELDAESKALFFPEIPRAQADQHHPE